MESVDCFLIIFIYQVSSVRPDPINLPIALSYQSSLADQATLSVAFSLNGINNLPSLSSSEASRSIESVKLQPPQQLCTVQESPPQLIKLATATNIPIKTIAASTIPLSSINLLPNTAQIQQLNQNFEKTSQISTLPQIKLSNLEISNVAPPVVVSVPGYFVINKDSGKVKSSLTPITLHSIPSNIYKVKFKDPIFIDCSKPTKSYVLPLVNPPLVPNTASLPGYSLGQKLEQSILPPQMQSTVDISSIQVKDDEVTQVPCVKIIEEKPESYTIPLISPPTVPSSVNLAGIKSIQSIEPPSAVQQMQFIQYVTAGGSSINIEDDAAVLEVSSVKVVEENPSTTLNNVVLNKEFTNSEPVNNIQMEKAENPDKILYPISNVKFGYGPNSFIQIPKICILPIVTPPDIEMEFKSIQNIASNQCNFKSSENNNYNNINCLESGLYVSDSSDSPNCISYQPYFFTNDVPMIAMSQLPNVNINPYISTKISQPTQIIQTSSQVASDTFASSLSRSLNSIISYLTSDILSKVYKKIAPKSVVDISPVQSLEIEATRNFQTPTYMSNSFLISSPFTIESPKSLPSPKVDAVLKKKSLKSNSKLSFNSCAKKSSCPKPYLSSITVNIIPSEICNDVIIVI